MSTTRHLLCAALISVPIALLLDQYRRGHKRRHPPSPPSIPFFGNYLSVPPGPEYLSFKKLGDDLNSDIIYLRMFGRQFVIANSAEAAYDLLEGRSAIYSDRSPAPMMSNPQLMGWSTNAGMIGYNDLWRHYRRLFNNWFNTRAAPQFHELQQNQARSLLRRLLEVSKEAQPFAKLRDEFFFTFASTMFQVGYGYRLKGHDDPFFINSRQTIHNFTEAAMFTNFLVNIFPIMIHIPDWVPGTGWKRTGREWRRIKEQAMDEPFEWTKAQVTAGTADFSILGALLQEHKLVSTLNKEERENRLKELGLIMYSGRVTGDQSANLLIAFVAAMVMNPAVQLKAQQEIDTVLGPVTLPTVSDVERLPYVLNLIKELKRWHPVVPGALPHTCFRDDNYRGYDIQKGTIVIGNVWAITRDERHYKNPEMFDPDRFLDPNVPLAPVFGWGRRKCPGLNLGEASLSVAITSLLATYTFSKKQNADGTQITPLIESDTNTAALFLSRCRTNARHPPRPKSYPLIGSALSIPSAPEQLAFMELGRQLDSDMVFLNLFGQNLVVLNSAKAAIETLDKRSAKYSDRSFPAMLKNPELMDWSTAVAAVGYGDKWRRSRRILNEWLNARAVAQFHPLQQYQVRLMLRRLLGAADDTHPYERVRNEFFYTMASTMFQLAYGYELQGPKDPFFVRARQAVHIAATAGMYSNFFVNIFPALSYLPAWLPGMSWKKTALVYKAQKNQALKDPYEWAKTQVVAGTAKPSILNSLLQDHPLTKCMKPEEMDLSLKELAFVIYAGGTDTSSNSLVSFVAAMVMNPHVQEKAQQEIDSVLGTGVLPEMSDRERLPYVNNLLKELFRWYPALPLALPHVSFMDDSYRGYEIKKGTTIIGNVWAITHDKLQYKDPEVFNPDRYLDPNMQEAPVFGWGRRKCPGSHFAEASMFLSVTSLLAMFTLSKRKGLDGKEITPKIEPGPNALALSPSIFEFEIKPRSEKHRQIILDTVN